jgi:hypothetical protein
MPNKKKIVKQTVLKYNKITRQYIHKKLVFDFINDIHREFIENLIKSNTILPEDLKLFIKYLDFELKKKLIIEINDYNFNIIT